METPETAIARYAARISLWALIFSGGSLGVALCVFLLELRRWLNEGVKLTMSVMVDAKFFGGGQQDDDTYIAVTVTNRGNAATTITHMVLYDYPNRFARWLPQFLARWIKSQRPKTFIVANPTAAGSPGRPPYVLEPGHNWHGIAVHTPDVTQMIDAGHLYVGVVGSHRDETLFKRVRRWTPPDNAKTT